MEPNKELAPYLFIGTKGILIFFSADHPNYGCIPVIGIEDHGIWLVNQSESYFDGVE